MKSMMNRSVVLSVLLILGLVVHRSVDDHSAERLGSLIADIVVSGAANDWLGMPRLSITTTNPEAVADAVRALAKKRGLHQTGELYKVQDNVRELHFELGNNKVLTIEIRGPRPPTTSRDARRIS